MELLVIQRNQKVPVSIFKKLICDLIIFSLRFVHDLLDTHLKLVLHSIITPAVEKNNRVHGSLIVSRQTEHLGLRNRT